MAGVILLAFVRPRMAGTIGVLAAIIAMIMLHELGHFVMAKRAGMKVTEFFLGFGPRLWSIRRGETEYGVKAIPAGGYVRIIGMSNVDEVDPADEERTYRAKPYRHRLGWRWPAPPCTSSSPLPAGPRSMPLSGVPSRPAGGRRRSLPSSPAQQSDFRVGDRIVAVNGIAVKDGRRSRVRAVPRRGPLVFTVVRRTAASR